MLFCMECGAKLSEEKEILEKAAALEELRKEFEKLEQERERLLSQLLPERRQA